MLRIPQNWNIGTCLWCLPSNVGPVKNSNFFEELALDQKCALLQGGVQTLMDFIFTSHTKIKEEFNVLVMDICAGAIHQDLPGIPMDCIITSPTKKIIRKNSKVWSWTYVCATVITFSKALHFH